MIEKILKTDHGDWGALIARVWGSNTPTWASEASGHVWRVWVLCYC